MPGLGRTKLQDPLCWCQTQPRAGALAELPAAHPQALAGISVSSSQFPFLVRTPGLVLCAQGGFIALSGCCETVQHLTMGPVIPCQIPRDVPAQEHPGLSSATPVSPHPALRGGHSSTASQGHRAAGGVTPPSHIPLCLGQSLVPLLPLLRWGQGHAGAPEQEPKDRELNSSSSLSP